MTKYPFGKVLRRVRKEKKISQTHLAELLGLSRSLTCEIESGVRLPPENKETLEKVSKALDMDLKTLEDLVRVDRLCRKGYIESLLNSMDSDLTYDLIRIFESMNPYEVFEFFKKFRDANMFEQSDDPMKMSMKEFDKYLEDHCKLINIP